MVAMLAASAAEALDEPAQYWHAAVPGFEVLPGGCHSAFCMGGKLAVGDFDGDGYQDLAVASEMAEVEGVDAAGALYVLPGSGAGLALPNQVLWQGSPGSPDSAKEHDLFGSALAVGDFDSDGADDLAVGIPWNDSGGGEDSGAVQVLYGHERGLGFGLQQLLTRETPGFPGSSAQSQFMGMGLAAADFNQDGWSDLAIGIPGENEKRGRVYVLLGSPGGISVIGIKALDQDTVEGASSMLDTGESYDEFGKTLASGDFNGDTVADLAIGVPNEDAGAGAVAVVLGSSNGLVVAGNQLWRPNSPGMISPLVSGQFGGALAAGDFDADGWTDLAIGANFAHVTTSSGGLATYAGGVRVLRGSAVGLTPRANRVFTQESPGIPDAAEDLDHFGYSLASGDFDDDGYADLAIGTPRESVAAMGNVGLSILLYGSPQGVTSLGVREWTLGTQIEGGTLRDHAYFGWALAAGDFDSDGRSDLAMGAQGDGVHPDYWGSVTVIYGPKQDL